MSVVTHRHLYCDGCEEPFDATIQGFDPIPHQRERARRDGWRRIRHGRRMCDLCPSCKAPRKLSWDETAKRIREAGGDVWDAIADPNEFIRWMRGDDVGAEYEVREGKWVRVPNGAAGGGAAGEQRREDF